MNIVITATSLAALQRGFKEAPEYTRQELLSGMVEGTQLLEREVKDEFPSVSGLTRASIFSDAFSTPAGVLGVVGSNSVAAAAVELGTKPHMPPVEPIEAWVNDKLGITGKAARRVAFAIALKIAKKGTKAQRPFKNTFELQYRTIGMVFERAAGRVATRLAGNVNGAGA